jgi:hypothetical protein
MALVLLYISYMASNDLHDRDTIEQVRRRLQRIGWSDVSFVGTGEQHPRYATLRFRGRSSLSAGASEEWTIGVDRGNRNDFAILTRVAAG